MAKKKTVTITRVCDDCEYAVPFYGDKGNPWNTSPDGRAITMHCHINPDRIRRGIFYGDPACAEWKKKKPL